MYSRKLKGDPIDPTIDFRGSVANRSKLSVCTLPPIPAIIGKDNEYEFPKIREAKLLENDFIKRKYMYEKPLPIVKEPACVQRQPNIPMPKKRQQQVNHNSNDSFFAKLGKRISTLGEIIDLKENSKENKEKRSISVPQITVTASPPLKSKDRNPNFEKEIFMAHNPKIENESANNIQSNQMDNLHKQPQVLPPEMDNEKQVLNVENEENSDIEDEEEEELNSNKHVYSKGNQIYLNFSNESESSLLSKLLDSYSQFNSENQYSTQQSLRSNSNKIDKNIPTLKNNLIYDFRPPEKSINRSSLCSSYHTDDDMFSCNKSAYSSGSSEYLSVPEEQNLDNYDYNDNEQWTQLPQKKYNNELSPDMVKTINQFTLRDYNNTENDSKIFDDGTPPQVPKHVVLKQIKSPLGHELESKEVYDRFSFDSSESSLYTSDNLKLNAKPVKQIEIPEDTSIFTRNSIKYKKKVPSQGIPNNKHRVISSDEYLKIVGINQFMLSGYQNGARLKVTNPEC